MLSPYAQIQLFITYNTLYNTVQQYLVNYIIYLRFFIQSKHQNIFKLFNIHRVVLSLLTLLFSLYTVISFLPVVWGGAGYIFPPTGTFTTLSN